MFLLISGKPLEAKFQGPFTVLQQIGPVDYMIAKLSRRRAKRLVYVNLLKNIAVEVITTNWTVR